MFVLLRIRKGCSIIKDWYGVKRACENLTFADLFDEFRNGTLDSSTPIDINASVLSVFVGPKKTELAYYTAGFESVCFYCGADENDQHPDHYPICTDCASGGKNPFPRRKRLPAKRN